MFGSRTTRIRRARLVPIALTTAALSSAVLGASVTGTLSAFNASITNNTNTATAGSLVMRETGPAGSTECLSSSGANNSYTDCHTINKYGGTDTPFIPDATHDTPVSISNTGVSNVTGFTLTPGTCAATAGSTPTAGDLCASLELNLSCVSVASGGATGTPVVLVNRVKLKDLARVDIAAASRDCVPVANSGNSVKFVFSVHMPAGQDNTVQGQTVSQNLTWAFTGA